MDAQTYTPKPLVGLRQAIENATNMARATGKTVVIEFNNARFSVNGDTKMQEAIDTYMEVKRKMFETEQKLKNKGR